MKLDEIKTVLADHDISVDIKPMSELFTEYTDDMKYFGIMCKSLADQQRVYHWVEFMEPSLQDFHVEAVYSTITVGNDLLVQYPGPGGEWTRIKKPEILVNKSC